MGSSTFSIYGTENEAQASLVNYNRRDRQTLWSPASGSSGRRDRTRASSSRGRSRDFAGWDIYPSHNDDCYDRGMPKSDPNGGHQRWQSLPFLQEEDLYMSVALPAKSCLEDRESDSNSSAQQRPGGQKRWSVFDDDPEVIGIDSECDLIEGNGCRGPYSERGISDKHPAPLHAVRPEATPSSSRSGEHGITNKATQNTGLRGILKHSLSEVLSRYPPHKNVSFERGTKDTVSARRPTSSSNTDDPRFNRSGRDGDKKNAKEYKSNVPELEGDSVRRLRLHHETGTPMTSGPRCELAAAFPEGWPKERQRDQSPSWPAEERRSSEQYGVREGRGTYVYAHQSWCMGGCGDLSRLAKDMNICSNCVADSLRECEDRKWSKIPNCRTLIRCQRCSLAPLAPLVPAFAQISLDFGSERGVDLEFIDPTSVGTGRTHGRSSEHRRR
jgi:hypothetical protein